MSSAPLETKASETPSGTGAIVLPFAIWALFALTALAALGFITVAYLNDLDRRSQQHLSTTAFKLEQERIGTLASEYSWWDEAIVHLFPEPDRVWIEENIGLHAQSNLDVDMTVVVTPDDEVLFAFREKAFFDIDPAFVRNPDIRTLIQQARRSAMDPVEAANGFALFEGKPYIFGVSPFSPETPAKGAPPDLERPVLIFGREIDAEFLRDQSEDFGFLGLRLTHPSEPSQKLLVSPSGTPVAGLTWEARASGTERTVRLMVPAIAVLIVLGGLGWYFLRRAQGMSRALAHAAEIASLRNEQLRQSESAAVRSQALAERASQEKDQALVELRQHNEELLRARHDAMEASQAKTLFLASMSHELRTPLNAIIGFSEILRDQRFGPLGSDRYVDYADNIRTSGTHLLALINDVLDISKIEAGKMTIEPEQTELKDLLTSTMRLFHEQAHVGKVTMTFDIDPPAITMHADPRALRQILVNLLSNALKFTRPGDEIRVSARHHPGGTGNADDDRVRIVVSDTGIGIPEEFQKSVFLPFNRGPDSSGKDGGTGLGLSLVKSLAELHGGSVFLHSTEGAGTTVTIDLPAAAPGTGARAG